ncbi:Origin recognition complex subunit 3 [Trametes pubescens]|uniref:Origin recognition complex subunit 3 n=1 Tax=Trametes pubescens TaxID=154538 RepID=A0A1M2V6R4_TRAPU|nr:Origin recognition complex subunit 3 [Trametes pubescens]
MKHFTQSLSLFARDDLLGEPDVDLAEHKLSSEPELQALVEGLQLRLFATTPASARTREGSSAPGTPRKTNGVTHENGWHADTAGEMLECVSRARVAFHKHARRMRVAFAVARVAERVALGAAPVHTNKGAQSGNTRLDSLEMLSAVLRGRAGNQVRYVCMAVRCARMFRLVACISFTSRPRKLPLPKLRELFRQLHTFWWNLKSSDIKRDEEAARVWIVTTLNQLPPETDEPQTSPDDLQGPQDPAVKQLAATVGDWLQAYIEERFVRLDEQVLWDIWYTGNSPFPSELVNPAPRPTVVAALLHPHDFARAHADFVRASTDADPPAAVDNDRAREPELWEMPDTSIAFRRYVEAGRMVNVYDWFESFAVVLETQRRKLRKRAQLAAQGTPRSQRNGSRRSRSTPKRRAGRVDTDMDVDGDDTQNGDESDDAEEEEMDEEEEEKWKIEVQARFMRALHELDYMGFVKHTGRKPDHVVRTIYDVPD